MIIIPLILIQSKTKIFALNVKINCQCLNPAAIQYSPSDSLSLLPKSGIWSEVIGMVADTLSWKTVRDRSTVTPRKCPEHRC